MDCKYFFFQSLLETKGLFRKQQRNVIPGAFLFDSEEHKVHLTVPQNKTKFLVTPPHRIGACQWVCEHVGEPMSAIHCSSVLGEGAAVKAPTVWSAKMKQFFLY